VKLNVKVLGLGDIQAELDRVTADLKVAEDPAQMAAAAPILEAWRSRVPIKDGNYRDSLTIANLGAKGAAVGTRWLPELPRNEQPVLYAKRLEFGDSEIHPQPSARPALAAVRQQSAEAGAEEFRSVVRGRKPRKRAPKGATA
jgi:hypothetical protein